MTDPLARAAAAGIHVLPVPTPFMVGRVNLQLIDDEPLTLVDTGPNSGKALDELEQALAAHGRRVEDIERILITHQHIDHTGLLAILARRSGAEVCALDVLAPVLADHVAYMERDDELAGALMLRYGVPRDLVSGLRAMSQAFRAWGGSGTVTRELRDGGTLEWANRRLSVHHRPGHSPSDTVFHDADRGILIAGDHLIAHISSNPLIQRPLGGRSGEPGAGRPRPLLTYLRSLAETRDTPEVDLVLSGHGRPIEDHAALIARRFDSHERRARRIERLIAERSRTAFEIAQELWGNVAVTQAYLALSEVLGHVDMLVERGLVAEREVGGVVRLEAVGVAG